MEYEDKLALQHLAGFDIVSKTLVYEPNAEFLFIICGNMVNIYATVSGELTRRLQGCSQELVSIHVELKRHDVLVGCTISGELLRWQWTTGELLGKVQLDFPNEMHVRTFNLLNLYRESESACAFVIFKTFGVLEWLVVDTESGKKISVPTHYKIQNHKAKPMVAVGTDKFKFIAIALNNSMVFICYQSWRYVKLPSAKQQQITCVRFAPKECMVATGDKTGKIFLWRDFMKGLDHMITSLYHWHHTEITSIAFTTSGTGFYSSGLEGVLVKWNVDRPDLKEFIPRMNAVIRHIAVGSNNLLAVCTSDNGVQFIGDDMKVTSTLQEFTFITDDGTGKSKFPIGLCLNPRTNTLVLNGRVGHLQFYSTYMRSLFYNMDIVNQNRLSLESGKILYNICVEKAAFSMDWMVTGETFNDEEHCPELRIKFWKFSKKAQNYNLNTNIEMPHERGFRQIDFSSENSVKNLRCISVGEDNRVKIWSLDQSDDFQKKGKYWSCMGELNYKDMIIESVSFSQDGSLIAAGFGNALCLYHADTLKLKAALTTPPGIDGCLQKVQIWLPKTITTDSKNKAMSRRKRVLQLFRGLVENNDQTLIKELQQMRKDNQENKRLYEPLTILCNEMKANLFGRILEMEELELFQKILLYQSLDIYCKVRRSQDKLKRYVYNSIHPGNIQTRMKKLEKSVQLVNMRERFKAKYRLQCHKVRQREHMAHINQNCRHVDSILNIKTQDNGQIKVENSEIKSDPNEEYEASTSSAILPSQMTPLAQIKIVRFAAGDYAYLVITFTENRMLVWNVLTLRLHAVLAVSVKHFTFDSHTNLIAIVTTSNELYVYELNVPLQLYYRESMPNLCGMKWMPRRYPKQRYIHVDWQTQSTLYFLTEDQKLVYLSTPDDLAPEGLSPIIFQKSAAQQQSSGYSTLGTFAIQKHWDKPHNRQMFKGALVLGNEHKTAVRSFVEMETHTMPPLGLLCDSFLKSLARPNEAMEQPSNYKISRKMNSTLTNGKTSQSDSDDDDDEDDRNDDDDKLHNGITATVTRAQTPLGNDTLSTTSATVTTAKNYDPIAKRKSILSKAHEVREKHLKSHKQAQELEALLQCATHELLELDL